MLKRLLAAALTCCLAATPALAQTMGAAVSLYDLRGQPIGTAANPLVVSGGTGGGGGGGTSGPYYVGQYNSSLPTFTSGTAGYLSFDSNGRILISPSSFPATQAISAASLPLPTGAATAANQNVTAAGTSASNAQAVQGVTGGVPQNVANGGTFAVQNTAAVVGGNATAVKTDGSGVTQPISASALPLPSGAATAANQSSEIAALGTTGDTAYTGSGNSSIVAALKGLYGLFTGGAAKIQGSIWFSEGVNQSVAANATFSGTARANVGSGVSSPYGYFQAQVFSTQAGTLLIGNGAYSISQAVTANTSATLKIPALGGSFTSSFVNGSTAATVSLLDGYTLN